MRINTVTILCFIAVAAFSCVDPLNVNIDNEEKILVVEGFITTLPGPHTIRLSESAKYGSIFDGVPKLESGAEVWLTDEQGDPTFLVDIGLGQYQTPPGFRGEVGKSYTLNIILATGGHFASTPETITAVPDIDSIWYQFAKKPTKQPKEFDLGVNVYLGWQDPGGVANDYLWRSQGVYPVEPCWISEQLGFDVRTDFQTNGNYNKELIGFISDNGLRFVKKYRVSVQQMSISRNAYQFFRTLKSQLSINGDIFDPPPATIRGNVINLDNPDENVIGYFFASDVRTVRMYINRNDLPETKPRRNVTNCVALLGSTTALPEDWSD